MLADLTDIRAGVKSRAVFSSAEMFRRLGLVRELMALSGLDALILTEPASITYYSNLVPTAHQYPTLLILTPDRSVTLSPITEGGHAYRYSFGDSLVYHSAEHLFGSLQRLVPAVREIGIESWRFPEGLRRGLKQVLPGVKALHALEEKLLLLRAVRSEEEIGLLRRIAALATLGYRTCVDQIRAGVSEYQLASEARAAMLEEAAICYPHLEIGGINALMQSGNGTDGQFNPPGARSIQPGDILNLACMPSLSGYEVHCARTLFLGYCEDEQLKCWDINTAVHRQAMALVAPGRTPADIAQELDDIYRRFGLLGNAARRYLGLSGESVLAISSVFDEVPLEEGMILSLNTELLLPDSRVGGVGYREISQLLVTADGCEQLTDMPLGAGVNRIPEP